MFKGIGSTTYMYMHHIKPEQIANTTIYATRIGKNDETKHQIQKSTLLHIGGTTVGWNIVSKITKTQGASS